MDEAHAIRLCLKHQDPVGFEFLVRKYRREAFFHARLFLGNTEDAVDACQESFARAFAAIPRLKRLDAFYPWFYRILKNCCLNMIRRKKTAGKYRAEMKREDHAGVEETNPSLILEKKEEHVIVWKVLEALNPEFREILVMKYIQGKRYNEIAELLNIPRGTVMSRLYHARKVFRDRFLKEHRIEDYSKKEVAP